jgi:hypothetical protein
MSTNFPTSLDDNAVLGADVANLTPVTDALHNVDAQFKNNGRDAVKALETKVGIDSSADTASHDYKIAQLELGPPNPLILKTGDGTVTAPSAQAAVAVGHGVANTGVADVSVDPLACGFAMGWVESFAGATGRVQAKKKGSFAHGCVVVDDVSTGEIQAGADGSFAGGFVICNDYKGTIEASKRGAFAHGCCYQFASAGSYLDAAGYGSGAFGVAYGGAEGPAWIKTHGSGSICAGYAKQSKMDAFGNGSFVMGDARAGSRGPSEIKAVTHGTFVGGRAENDGSIISLKSGGIAFGSAELGGAIQNHGDGSMAFGCAKDPGDTGYTVIQAGVDGCGSFAGGYVKDSGHIEGGRNGTFVWGEALNGADLLAYGNGSFVHGHADGVAAEIEAGAYANNGMGAFAMGHAAGGTIKSLGGGSFAMGKAATSRSILASTYGAFAFGAALAANCHATAVNAAQFGEGVNSVANSLQVGSTVAMGPGIGGLHLSEGQAGTAKRALTSVASTLTDCTKSNVFSLTTAGDYVMAAPTGMKAGYTYIWIVTNGASHTLGWANPIFHFPLGVEPVLTLAGGKDVITGVYDGTSFSCSFVQDEK